MRHNEKTLFYIDLVDTIEIPIEKDKVQLYIYLF